ncbi:YihY/virulence factor BrkB family protein [Pseudorhizobium endolithicum]|uniref:YihY/virulence factor BrkB family protein n=1 Tax=Pseudorhizobium endolithicum TaxID=1191678 RepID=A0ABN7JGY7_9HYPH|nr:YihY/virulence factor BrkB family protein [Pseudorhizobium endolithicum]CAD7028118.1 YihY/virulence factor BrkB family protein [Pseudorhizobium endolithicum]
MKEVQEAAEEREPGRGRRADRPGQIPAPGLKDVFWRLYAAISEDRVMLIAAGVTYYLLLALFPAMAALVSIYGFVASPVAIAERIAFLGSVMPADALNIFLDQLKSLASQDTSTLSIGLIAGLGIALWSANNGMKALFEAMNVAYQETEKRSFLKLNAISLLFTFGTLILVIVLIVAMGVVPALLAFLRLGGWAETIISVLRWPLMMLFVAGGIAVLYRFGPSREPPKARWLSWGTVFATVFWLGASIAVSFYLSNFADYNATYGTLGAMIGFMVWTWVSVIIVIVGAELNAELEHQTAKDTTTGPPEPMGARGAYMADTVGKASG